MMKYERVVQTVEKFLKGRLGSGRVVLLALSGGPDSLALLHALLACGVHPAIAHVDHQWRSESGEEAKILAQLAGDLELPFHLKALECEPDQHNLEERGRRARLGFFHLLCMEHGYQAVLLGHHADDQAETVLKRLFEGAALTQLRGMSVEGEWKGMPLWRPLLTLSKQDLQEWLERQGVTSFEDSTNVDVRFLRGRLRSQVIPYLEESFGKGVRKNLCRLADQSATLREQFDAKSEAILATVKSRRRGKSLDLTPYKELGQMELQYVVKAFGELEDVVLSREIVEQITSSLATRAVNKRFSQGGKQFYVSHGHLFSMRPPADCKNQLKTL